MIFRNPTIIWVYDCSFTYNLKSCNSSYCFRCLLERNFHCLFPSFIRTTNKFDYICN